MHIKINLIEYTCKKGISWVNWIISLYISLVASAIITWALTIQLISWPSLICLVSIIFLIIGMKCTHNINERFKKYNHYFITTNPDGILEDYLKKQEQNQDSDDKPLKKRKIEYCLMYFSLLISAIIFIVVGLYSNFQNQKNTEELSRRIDSIILRDNNIHPELKNINENLHKQTILLDSIQELYLLQSKGDYIVK